MNRVRACLAAVAVLITIGAGPAMADKARSVEIYKKAAKSYKAGHFDRALELFLSAYDEHPSPAYLYNIAQTYRELGNCEKALSYYDQFLEKSKRRAYRAVIERRAKKLRAECGDEVPAPAMDAEPAASTEPATADPQEGGVDTALTEAGGQESGLEASPAAGPTGPAGQNSGSAGAQVTLTHPEAPAAQAGTFRGTGLVLDAAAGVAYHSMGEVVVPITPAMQVGGGYGFVAGPVTLVAGGEVTLVTMPYTSDAGDKTALFAEVMATGAARYGIGDKIAVGAEVGVGLWRWPGLKAGNPFSAAGEATDAAMTVAGRGGVFGELALSSALAARIAVPVVVALAPDAVAEALSPTTRIEVLVGLRYAH